MRLQGLTVALVGGALALPNSLSKRDEKPKFEWTALGDSYASGVGSTKYVDGRRCLRYDEPWPVKLNGNTSLADGDYIFNNVACSGSHYDDVEKYQMYDENQKNKPNWQFSPRPKFGNPQMATISIGGDDIDFPGLIFNCMLDTHIWGGPPSRTCDDQRDHSWNLIKSPDVVDHIDELIKKIVEKGRKGTVGEKFLLYVTGYAEFFNEIDPACNDVTFAYNANPVDDGKQHPKLTIELRKDFNKMSIGLNTAVQKAVERNKDQGVKYVDIQADGALDGHRYCEKGIKEPDQHNDKLFFWHYPYNEPKNDAVKFMTDASKKTTNGLSTADIKAKFSDGDQYTDAIFDNLGEQGFKDANGGDVDSTIGWDSLGWRAKLFHPQVNFHNHIKDAVFKQYKEDTKEQTPESVPPSKADEKTCHGVGGEYWVYHKDTAVNNVNEFCSQGSKSVEYNQNTVDYLRLSVEYQGDPTKGPGDSPDCKGHFTTNIIDGCDSNDAQNNPHNYKFGGTVATGDGWTFKLEPLAKQTNEDTCDVTYKAVLDGFEIRGKNWPDAKLGPNGEGLRKEVSGCDGLTKWSFKWTPDDPKFQWFASGQTLVGKKDCIGRAVKSAGGSDRDDCHGSG